MFWKVFHATFVSYDFMMKINSNVKTNQVGRHKYLYESEN